MQQQQIIIHEETEEELIPNVLTVTQISIPIPHCTVAGQLFTRITTNVECNRLAIAFHGWLDNSNTFLPLITELNHISSSSCPFKHIIAVDMPGCGLSTHKPVISYPVMETVYDLMHIVNNIMSHYNMSYKQFTYIGHSLGGNHSLIYVPMFKHLVERLILIDALGYFTLEAAEAPIELKDVFLSRMKLDMDQNQKKKKTFKTFDELVNKMTSRYIHGLTVESARILAKRGSKYVESSNGWQFTYDHRHTARGFYRLTENQILSFIVHLTDIPILLLLPEHGGWPFAKRFSFQRREQLLRRVNDQFQSIKVHNTSGHHFHIDFPKITAKYLSDYLSLNMNRTHKSSRL